MANNPKQIAELEADLPDWQTQLSALRKVAPLAARAAKLRSVDIPSFETQYQRAMEMHADVAAKAEEVRSFFPLEPLQFNHSHLWNDIDSEQGHRAEDWFTRARISAAGSQ
jgi:hypothetical protein